ncbi:DUF192 domain-containing protein [Candidatus Bipolaricaulota bacterium]|nr:DUF192 domain-containing protein [Candidatus Bipolaricaulota bacterium]
MPEQEMVRDWRRMAKFAALVVLVAGVAFLVGLYGVAPSLARGGDAYVPAALAAMPPAVVQVTNPDGTTALLVVRLAETADARTAGLRGVGLRVLDAKLLLYAHPREQTVRTTYNMEGIRAPLELAIIGADGTVVAIRKVAMGTQSVDVTERHRWVLAAQDGLFRHLGIAVGSKLDPATIRKLR